MKLVIEQSTDSHLTMDYLHKYSVGDTFIETGTYLGNTIRLAKKFGFKTIHSIELDKYLFDEATNLFKEDSSIFIHHGDSIDILKKILPELQVSATFWLDAHASGPLPGGRTGGSPVLDELNIIKSYPLKAHTIFIDDRRLFGSTEWSFVSEHDALDLIKSINPDYNIHYLDGHIPGDIICASLK